MFFFVLKTSHRRSSFHFHLSVMEKLKGGNCLKHKKLSALWRDTLHFFSLFLTKLMSALSAQPLPVGSCFGPSIHSFLGFFCPHIIKSTSAEVIFWSLNNSCSITQRRWINIKMLGVERERREKCLWQMGVDRVGQSVGMEPGGIWTLARCHLWNYSRLTHKASYNRI